MSRSLRLVCHVKKFGLFLEGNGEPLRTVSRGDPWFIFYLRKNLSSSIMMRELERDKNGGRKMRQSLQLSQRKWSWSGILGTGRQALPWPGKCLWGTEQCLERSGLLGTCFRAFVTWLLSIGELWAPPRKGLSPLSSVHPLWSGQQTLPLISALELGWWADQVEETISSILSVIQKEKPES